MSTKVYANLTDSALAEKFNALDNGAFAEIYRRYWTRLYLHARNLLKDEELARDVVQDVFAQLCKRMGEMQLDESFPSYLYRCIRNSIIDQIRKEKVRIDFYSYLQYRDLSGACADEMIESKELNLKIENEIAALPDKVRQVFILSRKGYLNVHQIAAHRNVSVGTVKKQLSVALKTLKARLLILLPSAIITLLQIFLLHQN